MREGRHTGVVMGILPRIGVSSSWTSKAKDMNKWLHNKCIERGLTFVNYWDYFVMRPYLYQRDGVHLTLKGKGLLSEKLTELLQE